MTISYVPVLSENVKCVARKYEIYNNQNTVRLYLVKTKPKNGIQDTKNCMYSIKCECDK